MTAFVQEMTTAAPDFWFRLGETSGTNADDATSNANDGTYVNTPTLGATGLLNGESDTAVTFANASSEHITVPVISAYRAGTGSFAIFFMCANVVDNIIGFVFDMGSTGSEKIEISFDGDRLNARWLGTGTGAQTDRIDLVPMTRAVWLVADRSGNMFFEINGAANGTSIDISGYTADDLQPTGTMYIGCRDNGGPANFFGGTLDEIAGWFGTIPDSTTRNAIVDRALNGTIIDLQTILPDADVADGGWTTTPLWSKIEETSADGTVITATAS